ncbi:MAG: glycosyltransferase, partial [Planctomycetales bacterium]
RIAYVLERDISRDDGVVKKVAAQVGCWQGMGHETGIFALSAGEGVAAELERYSVDVEPWQRWRDWWARFPRLVDRVLQWQPEIVYFRFSSCFPAVKRLMRAVPTVLEINTDDVAEYRTTMTRKAYAYHLVSRGRLFRLAHGLVTMTSELAELYQSHNKPVVVVPNGIDLSSVSLVPAPENQQPRLIFLGEGDKPWHGVDKILRLAEMFPDWHFDVIGMAMPNCNRPNVVVTDFKNASDYGSLLAAADVGVGTLALHRKAMEEAAPIKVREYLAAGLPAMIAYRDPDFLQPVPFLLRLPNTVANIETNRDHIRAFMMRAKGMRVPRESIRHLDYSEKEQARVDFFERVLAASRTTGSTRG